MVDYHQELDAGHSCEGQISSSRRFPRKEDERAARKRQDTWWLQRFSRSSQRPSSRSNIALRDALYGTVRQVRELHDCCDTLKRRIRSGEWNEAYRQAVNVLRQPWERATGLLDEALDLHTALGLQNATLRLQDDACSAARRRTRRLQARSRRLLQLLQAEKRLSERQAVISLWRIKRIREAEEKNKEKELKMAADSVLCEVRKKQGDLKRMQDMLRSLEKLRRLRMEAASRRGISTEKQCDGQFSLRLEELRSMTTRRMVSYSAEEKALMVMLEGENEGRQQRERDKQLKEMGRQQERRRTADTLLFGDECPADFILHSFTQYYTQAQHCLHALIQIRKEWDVFLVAADHPNSSTVPAGWVFPEPPSDESWASALQPADCPPEVH